jgi:hypothetical protein
MDLSKRQWWMLILMVVAGCAIRGGVWAFFHTGAIGSEGAEYARIAENIRNGKGYVGIAMPGAELMFPPFYPYAIAAASYITRDFDTAGRLVSFLLGALLPLPLFGITRRLFGTISALLAVLLAVVHPLFIWLSLSVYTEGPYATVLLVAVWLALRALERRSAAAWFGVGATFGCAYLIRQEALAGLALSIVFLVLASRQPWINRWRQAFWALAAAALFMLPYVLFLYHATGSFRLEGKSLVNTAIGIRELDGQSECEANYAVDMDLRPVGVCMIRNVDLVGEGNLQALPRIVKKAVAQNTPTLLENLSARWLGAPFLPALALLGLCRRWPRRDAVARLFVFLSPLGSTLVTYTVVHAIFPRNYFVLVPFLIIWAAYGLELAGLWAYSMFRSLSMSSSHATWLSRPVAVAIIALMLVHTWNAVRRLYLFAEISTQTKYIRDAGEWIGRRHTQPVRVMDLTTPLAFHARGEYVHFPCCNPETAIRFLDAARVDYLILREDATFTKYYRDWLERGVPSDRAELAYKSPGNHPALLVYRWRAVEEMD